MGSFFIATTYQAIIELFFQVQHCMILDDLIRPMLIVCSIASPDSSL